MNDENRPTRSEVHHPDGYSWLTDAAERVLWTLAQVVVGVVVVLLADIDAAWVAPIATGAAIVKAALARKVGDPASASTLRDS